MKILISRPAEICLVKQHLPYLNIDSWEARTVLQKTFYFLQKMGVEFRYQFRWNLRGPFSQGLREEAEEAFSSFSVYEEEAKEYEFSDRVVNLFGTYQKIMSERIEDVEELSLLSCLHFLKTTQPNKDWAGIKELLFKDKPIYKNSPAVDEAIKELEERILSVTGKNKRG